MQVTYEDNAQGHKQQNAIGAFLDAVLSQPYLYAFFIFICIKPRAWIGFDGILATVAQVSFFPLFRTATYIACFTVFFAYTFRWATRAIKRSNSILLCIALMFLCLEISTMIFDGATGYRVDWLAGFAMMLMIDMGAQRERDSLVRALTGAFEILVYLNVISFLLFPFSITPELEDKEWFLGNHVFYYRIVFPALAFALVRYHLIGKKYKWRTIVLWLAGIVSVVHQRGGTALVGAVVLVGLLLWCNRRALPRYITPIHAALFALAVFVGIYYFNIQNYFANFITKGLGKSMTLTHRTEIWNKTMDIVFNNPITGVGYWPVAYMSELYGRHVAHTHNQLLELLLHGGVVALFLYFAVLYLTTREALRYRRNPIVKTVVVLISTLGIMGIAEIFHNDPIYYALFVLISRSECFVEDVKAMPRISLLTRVKRDLRRLTR